MESKGNKKISKREIEQFAFFKIPMVFVEEERYKDMSVEAKYLYGLMLNRMKLSIQNKWYDKNENVYIIFTLKEIGEVIGCKNEKAIKVLVELEKHNLIERKRQGLGKPSIIYVKNFIGKKDSPNDTTKDEATTESKTVNNNDIFEIEEDYLSENDATNFSDEEEICKNNITEYLGTDKAEFSYAYFENEDFRKTETKKNNNSKIKYSNNQSYQSISEDKIDKIDRYKKIIQKNIEYEYFMKNSNLTDQRLIDELYETMCDIVCATGGEVRINGHNYPVESVKSRFLKITQPHIEYILEAMKNVTSKIYNIKSYLTTVLFNAPTTMEHHYNFAY